MRITLLLSEHGLDLLPVQLEGIILIYYLPSNDMRVGIFIKRIPNNINQCLQVEH